MNILISIEIKTIMADYLTSSNVCGICCEEFNKSTRAKVNCPRCDYPVCRTCTRTYLIGTNDMAHCLNCKTRWELDTLVDATLKCFVNGDYKTHRTKMLFEQEQSRFPETMGAVENYKKIGELNEERDAVRAQLAEVERQYFELKDKNVVLNNKIKRFKNGEVTEKKEFKRGCPKEGCRGFLSTQWKCGLCDTKVCSKCFAIKEEGVEHVCDEDDLKSAEAIKKETRSCPSCGTNIFKIEGCDQMWCTQCHTGFSWRTGLKVTGVIHNPHFYQWQNQGGAAPAVQVPGAVLCGGIPAYYHWRNTVRKFFNIPHSNRIGQYVVSHEEREFCDTTLMKIHRGLTHFTHYELDRYRRTCNNIANNQQLRIKFICNEITEDNFKSTLIQRDKKHAKSRAILEVYELVNVVATETLRDIFETMCEENANPSLDFVQKYVLIRDKTSRLEKIRLYANKELVKISVLYNQTVGVIADTLNYTTKMKVKKKDLQFYQENPDLIGK